MIQRCTDINNPAFIDYGGRDIEVCERWRTFKNFLADMGACPDGLTIERIDNNKGYEPGNCCWATKQTQARNRRSSNMIEFAGKVQCLQAWADETGISRATIWSRIYRDGWSIERALTHGTV
jgi:hypothetical protein